MRGDENLAGTKGKSKKETSEFQRFFFFIIMWEISHSDIPGITTKAPCEVALMGERHVRIEISAFVIHVQSAAPSPSPAASLKAGSSGHGICGRAH